MYFMENLKMAMKLWISNTVKKVGKTLTFHLHITLIWTSGLKLYVVSEPIGLHFVFYFKLTVTSYWFLHQSAHHYKVHTVPLTYPTLHVPQIYTSDSDTGLCNGAASWRAWVFRFLLTTHAETSANKMHPFQVCLSSRSNSSGCRWHSYPMNHG